MTVPTANTQAKGSARDRLLAAANELFYDEGIQTVGIDRVIEQAGVAKASLYNAFGSKDELVRAYLESRHARTAERLNSAIDRHTDPKLRLLAVFEAQRASFDDPSFRGCAFASASAEARPGSATAQATAAFRQWLRELLTRLAREAGAPEPELLAQQLHLVYDGVGLSARTDADPSAADAARAVAETLVSAALAVA
jgi:AcrR family transcriptional regulator